MMALAGLQQSLGRRLALAIGLFGLFMLGSFLVPHPAHAWPTNEYPSWNNIVPPSANAFGIVTNGDGVNVTLHAPTAYFKVFYPVALGTGTQNVVITYACLNPGNDVMDGSMSATVNVLSPDGTTWLPSDSRNNTVAGQCVGGDFVFPVGLGAISPQADYYGPNYRVLLVIVQKQGGTGIKNFKVHADNAQVTLAENPRNASAQPGNNGVVHAIWDGLTPGSGSTSTYQFRWRTDCKYRQQTGANYFYLKWYDADAGAFNQPQPIFFNITNNTTGWSMNIDPNTSPAIGGNGEFSEAVIPINGDNEQFTWTWYNVNRTNGIQVIMPFSEMQDQVSQDCSWAKPPDKTPIGWLDQATCDPNAQTSVIRGWVLDQDVPNANIQYHVYFDGVYPQKNASIVAFTNQLRSDVNAAYGVGGTHGFSVPIPPQFLDTSQHTVYVFAIGTDSNGVPNGNNPMINGSGAVFGPCPPDVPPQGGMGGAYATNCQVISGWAADPDYAGPIQVTILVDGNSFAGGSNLSAGGADPTGAHNGHYFSVPYPDRFVDGSAGHTVTVTALGVNRSGVPNGRNTSIGSVRVGTCLNAACSVTFGLAIAGSDMSVQVSLTNTGAVAWDTGKYKAGITFFNNPNSFNGNWQPLSPIPGTNGRDRVDISAVMNPGQTRLESFTMRAPPNAGNYDFAMRMVREDRPEWFGARCTGSSPGISVSSRFKLVPITQPPAAFPDSEAPNTIVFNTGIDAVSPTPASGVNARATREFFWVRGGVVIGPLNPVPSAANPDNNRFIDRSYTDTLAFNPALYQAGDQFCVRMRVEPAEGFVDGAGNITFVSVAMAATDGNACFSLVNRPYLKAYGNDVWAGGGFADGTSAVCPSVNGDIKTFVRTTPPAPGDSGYRGSSVEFAAFALGVVDGNASPNGFYSASQRNSVPAPASGLTFANTVNVPWGGNYGANAHCITDFSTTTRIGNPASLGSTTVDLNSFTGQRTVGVARPGRVTIRGVNGLTGKHVLYVTGDVFIENNITFSTTGWNNLAAVPSLAVIVRGGNIYISNTVSQLDGMFVAEPNAPPAAIANTGEIFTCVRSNGLPFAPIADEAEYFKPVAQNGCSGPLVVNGSLTAQKIRWLRTNNSLRDAGPTEPFGNTRAAEIINAGPEVYVSPPGFQTVDGPNAGSFNTGPYDSIVSLPPIY